MSEDDRWTDVVDQVLDALDDANVSDPMTRDALAEGVKAALESMETGFGLDVQIIGEGFPETTPPTVEVVAGGRSEDAPPTEGQKPELRIAEPQETAPNKTGFTPDPGSPIPVFTHVNVRTNDATAPMASSRALEGSIRVGFGSDPEGTWQTVYFGARPRLYRIVCLQGTLDVTVDGNPIERLSQGQSIDTEAAAIRVTTDHPTGSTGAYTRVFETGAEE
jgi:hypothetical protein